MELAGPLDRITPQRAGTTMDRSSLTSYCLLILQRVSVSEVAEAEADVS
jgi:hypothetical protein